MFSFQLMLLVSVSALPILINSQQLNKNDRNVGYRLPNFTYPISYDISWTSRIDQGDFNFIGQVKIKIAVEEDTREIVVHAKQINLTSIRLSRFTASDLTDLPLQPHTYDSIREFVHIKTNGPLLVAGDRLLLDITYTGSLRTDNGGIYRTSYIGADGVPRQV